MSVIANKSKRKKERKKGIKNLLVVEIILNLCELDGVSAFHFPPVEFHLSGQLNLDAANRRRLLHLHDHGSGQLRSGDVMRILFIKKDL